MEVYFYVSHVNNTNARYKIKYKDEAKRKTFSGPLPLHTPKLLNGVESGNEMTWFLEGT